MTTLLNLFRRIRTLAELSPEQRKAAYIGLHVLEATAKGGK